jgi:GTP-binding protein HflX
VRLPGEEMLLTDTVGFIRNLPHHLVASFRATLEEVVHARLLLHVIDVSSPTTKPRLA